MGLSVYMLGLICRLGVGCVDGGLGFFLFLEVCMFAVFNDGSLKINTLLKTTYDSVMHPACMKRPAAASSEDFKPKHHTWGH